MSTSLQKALSRPSNYFLLSPRRQQEIDQDLGLAHWKPTAEEEAEFDRLWKGWPRKAKATGTSGKRIAVGCTRCPGPN